MKKPAPQTGDIIKFDYKWRSEHDAGRIDGEKDRPCAIVLAHEHKEGEEPRVIVAPITHSEPEEGTDNIRIPTRVAKAAGLDGDKQWVVTQEVNIVNWDNAGIVPAHPGKQWLYGSFKQGMAQAVLTRVRKNLAGRKLTMIDRDQTSRQKKR